MRLSVVWFRNDLRICDNVTLRQAINNSDAILPVYIFDSRKYRTSTYGFPKIGSFRAKFIIECVLDVRTNIRAAGGELYIRKGNPEDILKELCLKYRAASVYFSKEAAPYELKEEVAVRNALEDVGVETYSFYNSTLLLREKLPFTLSAMPDMFTAFRWSVERTAIFGEPLSAPDFINVPKGLENEEIPSLQSLQLTEPRVDIRAAIQFAGGEKRAIQRINEYVWQLEGPSTYFETRNQLVGANYSTKLSPWLAAGAISARYVYNEIKRYEKERVANKSTYWIGFELLWRDFFRLNMEKYQSELFFIKGPKRRDLSFRNDMNDLQIWIEGRTPNDFINANMNELRNTGYMSNRGRQVVASYLVHDLKINWLMGASYFESMLIDYDVCSNYGNWAYIAGVGNDPRENRIFNVEKQAINYDREGQYSRLWNQ